MLGIGLKQAPTGLSTHVDVVLVSILVQLDIGAMHSNDVPDLAHNGTILKPICVDNYHGKFELRVDIVALRVQTAINDLQ